MFKRSDSRGLSTIVATLIIILLVLVAVGILWVVVRNVIQGNAEQVSLGKLTLDLSIERIQISGNNLSITVKRNAGKGEFVGLSFVVEDGENSEVFTEYVSMNELDVRTFTFTLNQTNPDNIKKIKIVPIFRLKSGKEFVGEVKDTWEKSSSSGISQCTSNCPLGAECGSNGCLGGTCGTCSDPATPTCVNYQCVAQQTCTSNCTGKTCGSDGCEGNCGTCTNLHGTTSCVTGNCQPVCDLGYASCDLISSNGCETLLGTIANCANCSNSCLTGQNCTGDVCMTPQVPTCGDGTCNGTETCSNCVPDCACLIAGQTCLSGVCVTQTACTDTCESLNYNCGNHNFCNARINCGNCGPTEDCNSAWQCVPGTCDDTYLTLGYNCGYQNVCGTNISCGTCSYGLNCINNTCTSPNSCTDTCTSLGYGCGTHMICGVQTNCGGCGSEEICNDDNLCIATSCTNLIRDGTETGTDCGGICIDCIETTNIYGEDIFYVAPWGNDNNPGTFSQPWATWGKAFQRNGAVGPGDLVYFRGGIYWKNTSSTLDIFIHGDPEAPIRFFAYPGETPILDGTYIPHTSSNDEVIQLRKYSGETIGPGNLHFKGLEIRNFRHIRGILTITIEVLWGFNITFENMALHDNAGGLAITGMAYGGSYNNTIGKIEIINCDSYNNFDIYNIGGGFADHRLYSGGAASGITPHGRDPGSYHFVDGCRTWNNSDGGINGGADGIVIINNSWSFFNGYAMGDGNGFKGKDHDFYPPGIRKTIMNSIFAGNRIAVDENGDLVRYALYNNFVYLNGYNFISEERLGGFFFCVGDFAHVFTNNIEYHNADYAYGSPNCFRPNAVMSTNTWDGGVNVNDADFLSLDITELTRPRKANGSLPDVQFGHLVQNSDLVNAGTPVAGLPYSGSAPDLGPFESIY